MPSAKPRSAQPKSSLKREEARGKRKGKEVRELWFNPHAKKMGESLTDIYGCDCDCDVMLDEDVQRELRRLSKVYSQTVLEDEEEEEQSKGFLCFKKSSQRSRSKHRADKKKTKRRKSKERQDTEKAKRRKSKEWEAREKTKRRKSKERESPKREHERKSRSRPHTSAHGRFKTQEEVRRYRELKSIYTTRPRQRQTANKPTTATAFFKKKKDKKRENNTDLDYAESSSDDSVYSVKNKAHKSRKSDGESASKSKASTSKGGASSRQRRSQSQRENDKKQKKKEKKSELGCCGTRKKSKADKQEEDFEAYKLAQSTPKNSKKPTAALECPLTPEEIELLEKLKQTYAREKPKVLRKAPPPPPPEKTGCCGSKSKKKKRRSVDEPFTTRKTKSAEINVKRRRQPKTGKSKSDSSFYTTDRKEKRTKPLKEKNCSCFDYIRRRCQRDKQTKKPKAQPKTQNVQNAKKPVITYKTQPKPEKPKKIVDKVDTSKQKPAKTVSQEKVREQSPVVKKESENIENKSFFMSCCSLTKKEKSTKETPPKAKKDVQEKPQTPKAQNLPQKTFNVSCCALPKTDKSKKQSDVQQKPSMTRVQEKPQNKESKVSCCSFHKKEKSKKLEDTAQRTPKAKDKVDKLPKKSSNVSCCSILKKDKTKKEVEPKHVKISEKVQKEPTSKRKQEDVSKNVKSQESVLKQPSNISCCSFTKKLKPNNRQAKQQKLEDTQQKPTKKKSSEVFQKNSQKQTDDFPPKPPKIKEQTKVKKKPSEVSCCTIFEKDKPKKADVPKQKPAKVKSTENVQKKPSSTSVFSCCSLDKKSKPKTLKRTTRRPMRSKSRERTRNPFQAFCAFCKRRSTKIKPIKAPTPNKSTTPPRQEQIKHKGSKPQTKTKSGMSLQTCWDWCDGDIDNIPARDEKKSAPIPSETKPAAPKSKSSDTSFWTCCSSTCVPNKAKRQSKSKRDVNMKKQKGVDEGTLKPKPEDISYCKALYQEFENLVMQQKRCPILLSQTNFGKKSKGLPYCQQNHWNRTKKGTRYSLKTKSKKKQEAQKETKEIGKPKAVEEKESQRKLQKVSSAKHKTPKRKMKTKMQSENSTGDSGIENTYVPEYVLGKPAQLGVSLAHARHKTYSLILNNDARRKSDKSFHKGYAYGIGCQN